MNAIGFNTVSPVPLTGKEPLREQVPRRPRLSEPSELAQIHSKHHNKEPALPLTGPSLAKAQKKGRIVNMKGQLKNGRGTGHPLPQPSVFQERRQKVGKEIRNVAARRSIEGMFFESNRYDALTDACLIFEEQGPHLTLQFSGNKMHIFKNDVEWMKTDNLTYLFICIKTGARIHRELEQSRLWMPKTLDKGFPSHTISLQFQRHGLEDPDQHINGILDDMSRSKRPPESLASVSVAWSLLERRMGAKPQTTIETFDDDSDMTSPSPEPERPSIRSAARQPTRASGVDLDNDKVMLVYPFTGAGSTQITRGEHQRLRQNEFLNDTLVEFGLRHWLESLKETNPSLAEQIHVFSTFFYNKLKHKDRQVGYDAVKKWTSKVDIFQKRYLVVPIYERLHWYLVIVMYPEYILRSADSTYQKIEPNVRSHGDLIEQDATEALPMEVEETPESSHPSSHAVFPQQMHLDRDIEMKDSSIPGTITVPSSSEKAHRTGPLSPVFSEEELLDIPHEERSVSPSPKDCTWLLSFDSLAMKRPAALKTLRDYLMLEAKHRKGLEPDLSTPIISKTVPSPVQPNYYDSGIYLIKAAETFLNRPNEFFQRLMDKNDPLTGQHPLWNPEEFLVKREVLYETIAKLSLEWMQFKATGDAGKVPMAISAHDSKLPNSSTQPTGGLFTNRDRSDKIETVVEAPASRGEAARPVQSKFRRARRLS